MQNIVIDKPYVPVPPHPGRLWPALLSFYLPRLLSKKYGVVHVDYINAQRLRESIAAGHGVLLAPNHCRDEDPMLIGMLSKEVRSPFFIMASWHLFMQDRVQTFLLRRAGAFSIYREGIDRGAVNTAVEILADAKRPLVIFPEGLVSRTNDFLNELMDGTALIARSAAKKRAKLTPPGKVVVHPVAIRYHFQGNIESAVTTVLEDIETRLTWRKQSHLPMIDRIYKVGGALLTLKELEFLGEARSGEIAPRLANLIDAILRPLEEEWLKECHPDDAAPARVKRLRSAILPDMAKGEIDEAERQRRWKQLADLYLAQQLFHYPPDYARSNPTPERLLETVERFDEDLTDQVRKLGPLHATITLGEAIEVATAREARGSSDPLMDQIEQQLKTMLGLDKH
ncbi:MAG TPA: 1-acyl-sn-glycerol-3-phosphate acyltransferase [Tepidisphaeraceae bacterium]|jgi:1-acyl-sn-glycerol-3-phosphate acyltransferase|nr:1-acyl-sn-glycerol-3-phosphate acyltransferase [Tepidisphaeraceae bacterium]